MESKKENISRHRWHILKLEALLRAIDNDTVEVTSSAPNEDLECVKEYYGYSNEKASQALKILDNQQLNFIKQRLETGGTQ